MTGKTRINFTIAEKKILWDKWRRGESLSEIGRYLNRHAATIYSVLLTNGGYAPRTRVRSSRNLSLSEREEISRGLALGYSIRNIAKTIGRATSTVSREVNRNGGKICYRACQADNIALSNSKRPKLCLLAKNVILRDIVATKLKKNWSPEQISGWLKQTFTNDKSMQISHETIYRSLFMQARGVLKKELIKHLRSHRVIRQSRHYNTKVNARGKIIDGISIHQRPAEINDRAIPGHWEGDLISGSNNSHIATLVERHSRFTILVKVEGKDTHSVVSALTRQIKKLPLDLRRSLTWDRGMELAKHKQLTIDTNINVFFCDPKSPWQRGTNENTNRLLRQYFPKKTDLSFHSQEVLDSVAMSLNQRPRKTLKFSTPADTLYGVVAMTG
jgi:IS30 family transposase